MSLYGALFSGVSGLSSQSSAMGAIADNVANINTIGYKKTEVQFQTLVTKQVSQTRYAPGGVQSKPLSGVDLQGLLQATSSATDMGISGQGMFIVNEAANPTITDTYAYTRAGSFKVDKEGYLRNTAGWYLQGWPLQTWDTSKQAVIKTIGDDTYMKAYRNEYGETVYINDNVINETHIKPFNTNTIGGTATPTTTVSLGANLPRRAKPGEFEPTPILIYDSLGTAHSIKHTWAKRDTNAWDLFAIPPKGSNEFVIRDQSSAHGAYFAAGRLDFDHVPDQGTSMSMRVGGNDYTINFTNNDAEQISTQTLTVASQPSNNDTFEVTTPSGTQVFRFSDGTATLGPNDIEITIGGDEVTTASNVQAALEKFFDRNLGTAEWTTISNNQITFNHSRVNTVSFDFTNAAAVNVGGVTTPSPAPLNIDVSAGRGRSLSQVLNELNQRIHAIQHYENGGIRNTPPEAWSQHLNSENAITFFQGSTAEDIVVNAAGLTSNGLPSLTQNEQFSVTRLSGQVAWTINNNHAVEFATNGTPDRFFGYDETDASDPRAIYNISWANGAEDMEGQTAISVNFGNYNTRDGLTQYDGDYHLEYISQNGASFGNFHSVSINEAGVVIAHFDNGVTRPVFMIPIATMTNPNGLESLTGNVYIETDLSGQPVVREAGTGGAGLVSSAALESSTVDLGVEFTSMIITQRAYTAATKIITTADEMLDELMRVKR